MYYSLNEKELKKITEISDITATDYELKNNLILVDNLVAALEDMLYEYKHKEEELEDLKQDIDNNYELKRINLYEEYGISEKDFI